VRVPLWMSLPLLLLLGVSLSAAACGGSSTSGKQSSVSDIPSATLPSTLPDPIIIRGSPTTVQGRHYVVKSGDSPLSIAAQFGITSDELMRANGITDPTSLVTGVNLIIPEPAPGQATAEASTPPPAVEQPTATAQAPQATSTPSQQTYVVQQGDIPGTIAAKFGITADALMAANGITDPASLQVGQVLVIPSPSQ
jgi:LysM repeat protein